MTEKGIFDFLRTHHSLMIEENKMEKSSDMSFRFGPWIGVWFVVLGLVIAGVGYWEINTLKSLLSGYQGSLLDRQAFDTLEMGLDRVTMMSASLWAGSLVFVGILLWLCLRSSVRRWAAGVAVTPTASPDEKADRTVDQSEPTEKEKGDHIFADQRRSLHLLSLLQREGRLVDFLEEDLRSYDDAQIGAAVRSIHESCRAGLDKYVGPEAIIDRNEGDDVTIEAGFDPSTIKLTGNVSGEPPFRGTLQHRGWRAGRLDMPTVSGTTDPTLISPAEIEIA